MTAHSRRHRLAPVAMGSVAAFLSFLLGCVAGQCACRAKAGLPLFHHTYILANRELGLASTSMGITAMARREAALVDSSANLPVLVCNDGDRFAAGNHACDSRLNWPASPCWLASCRRRTRLPRHDWHDRRFRWCIRGIASGDRDPTSRRRFKPRSESGS